MGAATDPARGAQTSHAPHGTASVSPKCSATWRWRQRSLSANETMRSTRTAAARAERVEERLERGARAVADRQQLDLHRSPRVVVAADDAGLLEQADEHARVVAVADRVREHSRLDRPAGRADGAVDGAQLVRGRDAAQREASERGGIGVACEEHGVARGAVPACAADHLHVALERVGQVDEGDEPHVGLVDPHPERGRGDDDGEPAGDERVLDACPLAGLQPGVVVLRPDPVAAERAGDLLAAAARARVDDRGAAVGRAEAPEQRPQPLLGVLGALDVVAEVRAVDARPHDLEPPAEGFRDGVRVRGGRGRGHPEHRRRAELVERPADEEVVGAEVVPPHAHAVHLVDHDEADADLAQRPDEGRLAEPLGGGVEDSRLAGGDPAQPGRGVVAGQRRVDERRGRGDRRRQLVDLVLHERDQRREDERGGGPQHRRELVRERLPGARRHHGERVHAGERGADDGLLPAAEPVEAVELAQRGAEVDLGHPNECTAGVGTRP